MEETKDKGKKFIESRNARDSSLLGDSRRGYWFTAHTVAVNLAMTKERLIKGGFL